MAKPNQAVEQARDSVLRYGPADCYELLTLFVRQEEPYPMGEDSVDVSGTVFDTMRFDDDTCFLCGSPVVSDGTREHVFPKWLQHRHNLWDQELTLLNGTCIRYAQLTIPACHICNTSHLATLENQVRTAVTHGYEAAAQLSPLTIFQWAGKIFYGILRKELSLLVDRRDRDGGTIVPPDLLQGYSTLHLFLQSIRRPFTFQQGDPFSALVVNLHSRDGEGDYYFCDSLHHMIVAIRTRDIGFIVTLQDAGIISDTYGRYVRDVAGRKLMPIQFDELYVKCLYQMRLFTRVPKFLAATSNHDPDAPTTVHMLPIGGLGGGPVVEEWVQADYAEVLSAFLQRLYPTIDASQLFVPPSHVMTWMTDPEGNLLLLDSEGNHLSSG